MRLDLRRVDLAAVVHAAVDAIRLSAEDGQIALKLSVDRVRVSLAKEVARQCAT